MTVPVVLVNFDNVPTNIQDPNIIEFAATKILEFTAWLSYREVIVTIRMFVLPQKRQAISSQDDVYQNLQQDTIPATMLENPALGYTIPNILLILEPNKCT